MSDNSKYTLKTATKPGSCFICYKSTTAVLNHPNDFFFVCLSHIQDPSFCTPIYAPGCSPSEIAAKKTRDEKEQKEKDKQEKEELEKQKKEKEAKQKEKEKEEKKNMSKEDLKKWEKEKKEREQKEKEDQEKKTKEDAQQAAEQKRKQALAPSPEPPKPAQYMIASQIVYLREKYHRDRASQAKVADLLSQLPSVPK